MNAVPGTAMLAAQITTFLSTAQETARDGLTWAEFGRLLTQLLYLCVSGLDAIGTMTGPQKREVAVAAAAALFDTFADRCVPLAAWPGWLIFRPATRLLVLSLAAGAVEALLKISRSST